jgi:hypothetical protein
MNSQGSTERSEGYPWKKHPPATLPRSGRPMAAKVYVGEFARLASGVRNTVGLPLRGRNSPPHLPWVVLASLDRPMATFGEPSGFMS